MSKHTAGPWTLKHVSGSNFAVRRFEIRGMFGDKPGVAPVFNKDTSAIDGATIFCSPQDAALIASAPDLLEALEKAVNNEEQSLFEEWIIRVSPSGDCDSVHSQWLDSSDYEDFLEIWKVQIAAINHAKGESNDQE